MAFRKRRYTNQGGSGPDYSSVAFSQTSLGVSGAQAVNVNFQVGSRGTGDLPDNVVLDAEQVADLILHLKEICPCAVSGVGKKKKIIDE